MSAASGNSTVCTNERMRIRWQITTQYYRGNRFKVMNLLEESQVPEHTVRAITLGSNLRVEFTVRGSTGVHISV